MLLNALISEFYLLETALRRSLIRVGTVDERAELLRKTADALDRIEAYVPANTVERKDKAYFFLLRAVQQPGVSIAGRDVNIALSLGASGLMQDEYCGGDAAKPIPVERSIPVKFDSSNYGLIAFVAKSSERTCLIDAEYRFVAVSPAYAAFHKTTPTRLIGQPARSVTSRPSHFEAAKLFLDACLDGHAQEYYYQIQPSEDTPVMRCQMQLADVPHIGGCVLLTTRDVSDEVSVRQKILRPDPDGEFRLSRVAVCVDPGS